MCIEVETGLACDVVMLYVLALGLGYVNCVAAKKINVKLGLVISGTTQVESKVEI